MIHSKIMKVTKTKLKTNRGTARSLIRGLVLDLLDVCQRDQPWNPGLRVNDDKRWNGRVDFFRDRRQVDEVGVIDREATT